MSWRRSSWQVWVLKWDISIQKHRLKKSRILSRFSRKCRTSSVGGAVSSGWKSLSAFRAVLVSAVFPSASDFTMDPWGSQHGQLHGQYTFFTRLTTSTCDVLLLCLLDFLDDSLMCTPKISRSLNSWHDVHVCVQLANHHSVLRKANLGSPRCVMIHIVNYLCIPSIITSCWKIYTSRYSLLLV